MLRRPARMAVAVAAATLTVLPVALTSSTAVADQPRGYGPSDPFDDALMGDTGPVEPMKDQAKIVRTKHGYRYTAGQQNSHLTVVRTDRGLRFRDSGTRSWKSLPSMCSRQRVARGIAAVCHVPGTTSLSNPTLIEIHPRLGHDYIDARTLPASFELAILADAGRDVIYAGRGNDFVNGAQDPDRVYGGAGRDWLRGGDGADRVNGGSSSDYITGGSGRDSINGGGGADRVYPG